MATKKRGTTAKRSTRPTRAGATRTASAGSTTARGRAGRDRSADARETSGAVSKRTSTVKQTSAPARSPRRHEDPAEHYTDPGLRERLKAEIIAGDKGGRAGQWSARKAQLLAHAYEAAGGGYVGPKSETQRHLDEWTAEEWTTRDGAPARRGKTTARYLPKEAWAHLSPAEREATDDKKRTASRRGRQFVANTDAATRARADATAHDAPKPRGTAGAQRGGEAAKSGAPSSGRKTTARKATARKSTSGGASGRGAAKSGAKRGATGTSKRATSTAGSRETATRASSRAAR